MRILVVDDYLDNAASWAMLLCYDGHDVDTALDGEAALKAAQAHPLTSCCWTSPCRG